MNTGGGGAIEPLEAPVVAFPLRGRLNPYFWYLLPLIFISIFAYVSICTFLMNMYYSYPYLYIYIYTLDVSLT